MTDAFFKVIRNGLWGKHDCVGLSPSVAKALIEDAEKQTVLGVAFNELSNIGMKLEHSVVMKYYSKSQQIVHQNVKLNSLVKALAQLLDKNGVDFCIVKGQVAAQSYPKPELRQPGDIDFYCNKDNYQKAISLFKKEWGIDVKTERSDHHVEFEHEGVLFELHFILLNLYSEQRNLYWEELVGQASPFRVMIDDTPVKSLSPTLHSLYIFFHLYHHLMELGVGLRQFCDWAAMLHHYHAAIRHDELRKHLQVLGMECAYRACGCILVDKLGLPAEEFSYELDEGDRHYAEKIVGVVDYRGNMGKYNKQLGFCGWKHNIETTIIKLSHYFKFRKLAPSYSYDWLMYELKRKMAIKLR